MSEDELYRLRTQIEAAHEACQNLEADIQLVLSNLQSHIVEMTKLTKLVKQLHHDHQSTRSIVINLLAELDILAPSPKPS